MTAQLDILESTEIEANEKIKKIEETCHNVRRGIFARFMEHKNDLGRQYLDLHKEIETVKQELNHVKKLLTEKSI